MVMAGAVSDQLRFVVPVPSVASRLVVVFVQVPADVRNCLLLRSWIRTCTRPTLPVATRAEPVTVNGVFVARTRPSIGVSIVVSGGAGGFATVLKS